jgi:Tol biopolymer transport system component
MTKIISTTIIAALILGLLVLGCSTSKQLFPKKMNLVKPHIKKEFLSDRYIIPILGSVHDLDIRPDGKRLTFTGEDNKIWTSDIDGRNQQRVSNLTWDSSPTWSPDGKKIAFQSYHRFSKDFKIWVVGADGKNLRQLEDTPSSGTYSQQYPQWSPDGLSLVWSEGDRGLRIANIDGKNGRNLTEGKGFQIVIDWSPDGQSIYYWDYSSCDIKSPCRRIGIDGKNNRESNTYEIAQLEQKLSDRKFIYQCQENKIYRLLLNNRANRKVIFDVSRFPRMLVSKCKLSPDSTKLIFNVVSKGGGNDTAFIINLPAIK